MRRVFIAILACQLVAGCVPKGRYEDALADQKALQGRIDAMNVTLSEMGAELTSLGTELAERESALEELRSKLAAKMAEAGALEKDVAEMEEAMAELERRRAHTEQAMASYRDLVGRFQAMIDAGTLQVKVLDGRLLVELATDVLFPAGSASLSREGSAAVADVAKVLAAIPDREYQVAGHTDGDPIRTQRFPSNWHLGSARAIAVAELLVKSGLGASRVSAASYAEHRPIDTNRTPEGKANNRRIDIVVMPDLSILPGYDEVRGLATSEADPKPRADPE